MSAPDRVRDKMRKALEFILSRNDFNLTDGAKAMARAALADAAPVSPPAASRDAVAEVLLHEAHPDLAPWSLLQLSGPNAAGIVAAVALARRQADAVMARWPGAATAAPRRATTRAERVPKARSEETRAKPEEATVSDEIDCDYTDDVVCPWCGHSHDSTDFRADASRSGRDDGEFYCDECGKPFTFRMNVEVTFSSEKKQGGSRE